MVQTVFEGRAQACRGCADAWGVLYLSQVSSCALYFAETQGWGIVGCFWGLIHDIWGRFGVCFLFPVFPFQSFWSFLDRSGRSKGFYRLFQTTGLECVASWQHPMGLNQDCTCFQYNPNTFQIRPTDDPDVRNASPRTIQHITCKPWFCVAAATMV